VPRRGKRNEPAFLVHTAEKIASLKNLPLEEVAKETTLNARRLFKLPKLEGEMTANSNE
jgi:TatD DNase family protein